MKIKLKLSYIVTSTLFLQLLLFSSCTSYRQELQNAYLELANNKYEDNKYAESLDWFIKAEKYTTTYSIQIKKIELYFILERLDEARRELDLVIKIDPKNEIVLEYDAYWYLLEFKNSEAIEKYELLLKNNKFNFRTLSNLAVLYGRTGDVEKSIEYFQKAFSITSTDNKLIQNYLQVLFSLVEENNEETEGQEEQEEWIAMIHMLIEAIDLQYKNDLISKEEVRKLADKLLQNELINEAYVLYSTLISEKTDETKEVLIQDELPVQNMKAEINLKLAEILLARDNSLEIENASQSGLDYLRNSLEGGLLTETAGNRESLRNILIQVKSLILKERIENLYSQYEISIDLDEPNPDEVGELGPDQSGELNTDITQ